MDSLPRRENFRKVRARVEGALGEKTLMGDLKLPDSDSKTCANPQSSSLPPCQHCWLLFNGEQLPLRIGLNSVGRLPDNDIILDDDTVSRRHCAIVVHSNLSVELYDIASKNGTKINNKKLKGPSKLTDGDEITICGCKMMFVMKSGTPTVNHSSIQLHLADDVTQMG